MNARAQAGSSSQGAGRVWVWAALALTVGWVAITRQSLWIDEALTAVKAGQPDFQGWWTAMRADKASDLQMPLYMIYEWGFVKIFGTSEWALRAANLPWFVAGVVAWVSAFRQRFWLGLVALASPFAWFYLDEARPYAMQLGASLMIVAALRRVSAKEPLSERHKTWWVAIFLLGIISLSGSSLLGMIWAGAGGLSLIVLMSPEELKRLGQAHWKMVALAAVMMLALAGYYLWTLKMGARASDVGTTGARNIFFIAYELLGFSGLGPGRLTIREGGMSVFVPYVLRLGIYAALGGYLVIVGVRRAWDELPREKKFKLTAMIVWPAILIISAGVTGHFRVLGRHFMPLLPLVLMMIAWGMEAQWQRRHWISKLIVMGFVALSLWSCASLRWSPRHAKDDYRDAAARANMALRAGQTVWWNAGKEGAVYYQVPLEGSNTVTRSAVYLMNPTGEAVGKLASPDVIIVSKPDVYDGQGAVMAYLTQRHYLRVALLSAFTIWRRE